jgi:poly(3-hydroxybutyrate) depolymerase
MPELPDVTVYVERMQALLGERVLQGVRLRSPFVLRTAEPPLETVTGKVVRHVSRSGKRIVMVLLLFSFAAEARDISLEALGKTLRIDPTRISVSGLSSGAYMAQQFHVIHSSHIMGVGLVAGGPYRCAAGVYQPWSWFDVTGLYAAMSRCSNTNPFWFYQGAPDVAISLNETRHEARHGGIDDPKGLQEDRVWLLSGGEDDTVPREVVDVLADYYQHFVTDAAFAYEKLEGAGHAMITLDRGNPCGQSRSPFISDCDFDAAGALLSHIYGSLNPRAAAAPDASIHRVDQRPYYDTADESVSLHGTAYVYVPQRCRQGSPCSLHVAFHGCQQSVERIGEQFVRQAGYNEWAESNDLVIFYPQARAWSGSALGMDANPKGCWDWWGYSGSDYHRRNGKQPAAVANMIDVLLGKRLLGSSSP